jgi:ABC-type multidrug transport system fused ATPase/permease subunit
VIELKGVSASYRPANDETSETASSNSNIEQLKLALRNINLTINPGEKLANCGRTGSGKSSLLALLLKVLDPVPSTPENAITMNHTPLQRIDRATLRERLIAVPQEAIFLPDGSTFQDNLDTSGVCTAEECQAVLEVVGLWGFVQERGGLDVGMSAGAMSAGQRQLLSLGRALLRRRLRARGQGLELAGGGGGDGGILLLDEVSSSVDRETEGVMREVIAAEFKGYTILAVSHRLGMIMDFDRVVVMDKGEIAEVGNPGVLAAQEGSRFGDLVRAVGN